MTYSEYKPTHLVEAVITEHAIFGYFVVIQAPRFFIDAKGVVEIPVMQIEHRESFPLVGTTISAVTLGYSPIGQLRLSTRSEDLAYVRQLGLDAASDSTLALD